MLDSAPRRLSLLYQLYLASQASRHFMKLALASVAMSGEEYALFSYLHANGPRTLTQTARDLGLPVTSLATALAPQVEAGRVERRAHPRDGRARLLSLTNDGEAALAEAIPPFSMAYRRIVAQLERAGADVGGLFDALDVLRAGIEAASDELQLGELPAAR